MMMISKIQESLTPTKSSPWSLPPCNALDENDTVQDDNVQEYHLYLDIGRDPGTWMDPRWGASGHSRIELTLDVWFQESLCMDDRFDDAVVKDNSGGESSAIYELEISGKAQL